MNNTVKGLIAAASLAVLPLQASALTQGTVLAQGNSGDVYAIDVNSLSATLFRDLDDFNPSNTQDVNSPNALAFSAGATFRTNFSTSGGTRQLYRDDTLLVDDLPSGDAGVASGDAVGDTYYYMDNAGNFRSVSNVTGVGPYTVNNIATPVPGFSTGSFGDIAIKGDKVYLSGGSGFGSFNLDGTGFSEFGDGSAGSMAGLAFVGNTLYGMKAGNGSTTSNTLWSIAFDTGVATSLGDITFAGGFEERLTDLAAIPLPAGVWLLIGGVSGFGVLRRMKARRAAA